MTKVFREVHTVLSSITMFPPRSTNFKESVNSHFSTQEAITTGDPLYPISVANFIENLAMQYEVHLKSKERSAESDRLFGDR